MRERVLEIRPYLVLQIFPPRVVSGPRRNSNTGGPEHGKEALIYFGDLGIGSKQALQNRGHPRLSAAAL